MTKISIWGYQMPCEWLSDSELDYLKLLPQDLPSMDWVCGELDRVWYEQKLDNRQSLLHQNIGAYYGHPVWLMNGLFSVCDPTSYSHREAIAAYIKSTGCKKIADYGGGFGQLAISIAQVIPDGDICIVEPYPSKVGIERLRGVSQVKIIPKLSADGYEAIVAQDVLEHVEDPIKLAYEIASSVRIGGKVIFANCFYPVIQCHLPKNFYLRHTFPLAMKALGLRYVGSVEGAEHAQVFERICDVSISKAKVAGGLLKFVGNEINKIRWLLSIVREKL